MMKLPAIYRHINKLEAHLKALFLTVIVLFMTGCATGYQLQQNRADEFKEVSLEFLQDDSVNINEKETDMWVTPLAAAILFAPERVPKMIKKGAKLNGFVRMPTYQDEYNGAVSYVKLAIGRSYYLERLWDIKAEPLLDIQLAEMLLDAGADVDLGYEKKVYRNGFPHVTVYGRAMDIAALGWSGDSDIAIQKMRLLALKYGSRIPPIKCYASQFQSHVGVACDLDQQVARGNDKWLPILQEIKSLKGIWDKHRLYNKDIKQAERTKIYEKYASAGVGLKEKKAAVLLAVNSDSNLKPVFQSVVSAGQDCKTMKGIRSRIWDFSCAEYNSNIGNMRSSGCESAKKQLTALAGKDVGKVCGTYEELLSYLTSRLGNHAELVTLLIDDEVFRAGESKTIKRLYEGPRSSMASIKKREILHQETVADSEFKQSMGSLVNHMQKAFTTKTSAEQLLVDSMKDTQQSYQDMDHARKKAELDASLNALDKKIGGMGLSLTENPRTGSSAAPSKVEIKKRNTDELDTKLKVLDEKLRAEPKASSIRVCGNPVTLPAMNKTFTVAESNKVSSHWENYVKKKCPAGARAVNQQSSYVHDTIALLTMGFINFKTEPVENGRVRMSWDKTVFDCVCTDTKQSSGTMSVDK